MATFTWDGHDGSGWNLSIGATNLIKFAGSAYATKVIVGEYQDSTHIRTASGTDTDACTPIHLHNIKYTDSNQCSIDGAAAEAVTNILTTECIRINFSHGSSVATENAKFYAYSGGAYTTPPTDVTFQALEQGDSSWSNAEGSASALALDNQSAGTSHNFYIAMSASPESTGEKTAFVGRIELDYY